VWTVAEGTLSLTEFDPVVEPTDEDLEGFYQNNDFRYEIPERMTVGYIVFDSSEYLASVELLETEVSSYFDNGKERYQTLFEARSENAEEDSPNVRLDDVRETVESDLRLGKAINIAIRTASDFAYALFENSVEPETEIFSSMVSESGLELRVAPPFSRGQIPDGIAWDRKIVEEAFKLTPDHLFSDPLTVGNTVILVFYQDRLAAYTPEFSTVRAKVLADYKAERKRELFVAKGEELKNQLQEAVDSGTSFFDAASESGLETKVWTDFTFQTPLEDFNYSIVARLDQIPVGGISDMVVAGNIGSFVHVVSRSVPGDEIDKTELETTRKQIANLNANLRSSLIFNDMISEELIRAGLTDVQ